MPDTQPRLMCKSTNDPVLMVMGCSDTKPTYTDFDKVLSEADWPILECNEQAAISLSQSA
jgi:hypothetical protein